MALSARWAIHEMALQSNLQADRNAALLQRDATKSELRNAYIELAAAYESLGNDDQARRCREKAAQIEVAASK